MGLFLVTHLKDDFIYVTYDNSNSKTGESLRRATYPAVYENVKNIKLIGVQKAPREDELFVPVPYATLGIFDMGPREKEQAHVISFAFSKQD